MWRRLSRCFCQTLIGRFGLQAAERPAGSKRRGELRSSGRTTAARLPVGRCSWRSRFRGFRLRSFETLHEAEEHTDQQMSNLLMSEDACDARYSPPTAQARCRALHRNRQTESSRHTREDSQVSCFWFFGSPSQDSGSGPKKPVRNLGSGSRNLGSRERFLGWRARCRCRDLRRSRLN